VHQIAHEWRFVRDLSRLVDPDLFDFFGDGRCRPEFVALYGLGPAGKQHSILFEYGFPGKGLGGSIE
jgi:hypothetical protein